MRIEGNNVSSTDIIDSRSLGGELAKHELISVLSLPQDETFISPDVLPTVDTLSSDFLGWHRYAFSGRSFLHGFEHNGKFYDFAVKGGHLLQGGEIYKRKALYHATPAWGSETVPQLYTEFTAAHDIQNISLAATGLLAPLPIPLKVSRLDTYKYEGDIEEYKTMIAYVIGSDRWHQNNMILVMNEANIDVFDRSEENAGKIVVRKEYRSFSDLFEIYWSHFGPHGSYQYLCEGTNMRVADLFKAKTRKEMQEHVRSFYPGCGDEKICELFMSNFGKAQGAIRGSGYHYKTERISGCYAVDTTILGHTMDIDGYTYHEDISDEQRENMYKTSWAWAELSHLFYRIFFDEGFLEFYKKHFVDSFVDTYIKIFDFRAEKRDMRIDEAFAQEIPYMLEQQAAFQIGINRDEKKFRSTFKYLGNILEVTGLGTIDEAKGYDDAE